MDVYKSCQLSTRRGLYRLPRQEKGKHRPFLVNMDPLTHIPALAPPAGVTPNFINPQSQASMVVITSILCLVLIIPISILRFYTNLFIKRSLKVDDSKYQYAHIDSTC